MKSIKFILLGLGLILDLALYLVFSPDYCLQHSWALSILKFSLFSHLFLIFIVLNFLVFFAFKDVEKTLVNLVVQFLFYGTLISAFSQLHTLDHVLNLEEVKICNNSGANCEVKRMIGLEIEDHYNFVQETTGVSNVFNSYYVPKDDSDKEVY